MTRASTLLLGLSLGAIATASHAQQRPAAPASASAPTASVEDPDLEGGEVTVTGQRERGSVPGDIKPELQLSPADIRSYGVSSITDLLAELAPQTRSDQGRGGGMPVVLLNGRRISGFGEIRDIPTEAIERVDILPAEAALKLGFRGDQRVVNFVLRRRFRAITGEAQAGGSTEGGRLFAQADANLLRISRDRRLTLNLHYDGATALFEADRDLIPTPPTRPYGTTGNVTAGPGSLTGEIDPALSALAGSTVTVAGVPGGLAGRPALGSFLGGVDDGNIQSYRTLSPATRKFSTNATYSRTVAGNVTASLNASLEATVSDARQGLGSASYIVPSTNPFSPFAAPVTVNRYFYEAGARQRQVDGNTGHVGLALNGDIAPWHWSFTGNYDRVFSRTLTDTNVDFTGLQTRINAGDPLLNPFATFNPADLGDYRRDRARSITSTGNAEYVINGPLIHVPAGKVSATFKAGFESSSFDARALRSGIYTLSGLGRDTASGQGSVDVPITSRRNGFGAAIGDLSLNGNYAIDQLSDFGRLRTVGYGVNYSPIVAIRFIASVTDEEGPPSVAQLGNPVVVTNDVRVFDFVRGTSVDITQVDGGNRVLLSDDRRTTKFGLTLKPFSAQELTFTADYIKSRTLNPIASFPAATAAIEAAFPTRFTRDGSGNLLRIDNRPVNFAREDTAELRWGFNFSKRIGPAPPQRGFGGFGGARRQRPEDAPVATPAPPPGAPGRVPPSPQPDAPPPTARPAGGFGGGPGGRGGFGGGGFGGGGGRLQFAAYHTWHFRDEILIRPGVPLLDLLDGAATGSRGGQPEHEVELQAGITKNGLGARISGNWQSGTFVRGGTAAVPTDLNFSGLGTLNLRLFADFTPIMKVVRNNRWLRGARVTFSVQNLFDTKLKVTDPTGTVPINYQPGLLDPTGRTVRLSFRKLFF
ncbi:TonB-dependent receptor plug domain-containing protein [soil metagenome]